MKAGRGEERRMKLEATRCWYVRFKETAVSITQKYKGEQQVLGEKLQVSRSSAEIIHEGGCATQHVFNVDETASHWKKMLSRTFPARERSMPSFKASEARLTLLGQTQLQTLSRSQCSFTVLKIPRPLSITLHLPCLCSGNGTKPG